MRTINAPGLSIIMTENSSNSSSVIHFLHT